MFLVTDVRATLVERMYQCFERVQGSLLLHNHVQADEQPLHRCHFSVCGSCKRVEKSVALLLVFCACIHAR